jgi:murein DD-endopeptidase MepM/ murein hydrolase activator NlpD
VNQGQQIGVSWDTGVSGAPHLHFEVLKLIPGRKNTYAIDNYAVVDPYGWVGVGSDPLYSRSVWGIAPAHLWQ